MIVYGEMLFAENMIIGGVLLYITAMIHGRSAAATNERLRFLAGAMMCGLFSMVIFLDIRAPLLLLMELLFAVAVCGVTFGGKRTAGRSDRRTVTFSFIPWQKAITFILVTYFMGGVTMGLLLVTDHTGICTAVGIYTGDMKAALLALFTATALFTSKRIVRTVRKRKFYQEHVFDVIISVNGCTIAEQGFLDTGNNLREPVSGHPVAVSGGSLWHRMEVQQMHPENRFRMIPYETVSGKGILEGVRTDYIEVNGRRVKDAVIARSDGAFHVRGREAADYELLLPKDMLSDQ